ncbi:phosphoribosylglycinamide formyltransferase [Xanthomonas melonis]|uniref:Phosphoribosylglycinamide formyltransferase n=1 Tax=Xanthomonas melonis TaxID=56456 RepID=A0ABS8NVD0_9XANT|nr:MULTISPECIES: phosphoribosylglycinamide formyltransferase [Xanthomonas]MCC4586670.1 phosphoribosylglycinamide formyltransferase [Xanthomonas sp. NCPPB 1067]MCD0247530.1 phosphoribosylglycinamide formyltransferase [Xanthomonas melonis]MCD0260111.1 phosphoribosylglycinamide formyltransferase [Xanthomonas melonis]MCD0267039.1 phosphoribosylglycinamide formyltransferase [Xanthomonas melonis]
MHATDPCLRLAILASGRGSNLQAILDAIADRRLRAEVVGVFSDRPQAPALLKVDEALRWSASPRAFADREAFDAALGDAIAAVRPDWVVCAGYMRILGEPLVRRFAGRMLNIHPSLLPKYRGLHTHARALEAGDTEHGASVHLVVPELDAGNVIAQARVPVLPGDSADQLAARVLGREHPLLLATLDLLASGRVQVHGDAIHLDGQCLFTPLRLESADTALA